MNGEDTSSSSSEEEKEGDAAPPVNGLSLKPSWSSAPHNKAPSGGDIKEDDEDEEGTCLPTIYFSHTVEPKKVRVTNNRFNVKDIVLFALSSFFYLLVTATFSLSFFLLPLFHLKPVFVIC